MTDFLRSQQHSKVLLRIDSTFNYRAETMGVPKEQATGISYGDNLTFLEKGKGVE